MIEDESSDSGDNPIQSNDDCELDAIKDIAEMSDDETVILQME